MKNAVCFIEGNRALISRDHGSLETPAAIAAFQETAQFFLEKKPQAVAHDWHPDFYCTRWAAESGLRTFAIQHHHAHIAALMAEHGRAEPTLGLALDGFGLGADNQSWGGELLRVDRRGFTRLGYLKPLPQPGGDVAARQPWRMGAAALWALGRGEEIATRYAAYQGAGQMRFMMDRGLNAPLTSSAGRLFDAACGLLEVVPMASFEGEAPIKLESMVTQPVVDPQGWRLAGGTLDMRPLLAALADLGPAQAQQGANLFHGTLAAALLDWARTAAQETGIRHIAFGGGCFFNKVLRQELSRGMMESGLASLWPEKLSAGDPAIAIGQAYAAALMLEDEK